MKVTVDVKAPLSDEDRKMLRDGRNNPIVYDEDCPKLTAEQLAKFKRVVDIRREQRFRDM